MKKTILITGSTDGIGLETAKRLIEEGHHVILHGRDAQKVKKLQKELSTASDIDAFVADLSELDAVRGLADEIKEKYNKLDVLINNAGVYKTATTKTVNNIDIRFVVNTIAPYLLTKELLDILPAHSRVVNISSAAQASVELNALSGKITLSSDSEAYAQSKLALIMWSFHMAKELQDKEISIIALNPKSFLGSKMVKEAYGIAGVDVSIGVDILCRASFSEEFANANGKYFDNDRGQFALAHPDTLNAQKCKEIVKTIDDIIL